MVWEKDCVTMRNAAVGGKFKFKLEAGDEEETEKTVQVARELVGQEYVDRE